MILSRSAGTDGRDVDAICVGSGRFLRSVLVPFLSSSSRCAVFQTRGRTFLDSFAADFGGEGVGEGNDEAAASLRYEVDTVEFDGKVSTSSVEIHSAGTLGTPDGRSALMDGLLSKVESVSVIGVGVTEAGLQSADNQCMVDLAEVLHKLFGRGANVKCANPNGRVCVVNTDNVPDNGDVIKKHVLANAKRYDDVEGKDNGDGSFADFVENRVAFLDSMVDRITSSGPGSDGLVPRCEPLPAKALVVCDPGGDLPAWMGDETVQAKFGVKIRRDRRELESDIALKLRVANGTHTAVAHAMALHGLVNTEALSDSSPSSDLIMSYLDSLLETQILPGAVNDGLSPSETKATWVDWRRRLRHPKFGLSTFFITQNGAAKCGIRLGPTIRSLVLARDHSPSVSMAFAVAAILRFLTPASAAGERASGWSERIADAKRRGMFVGWLDVEKDESNNKRPRLAGDAVTYADGMRYNLAEGWYEFRCDFQVSLKEENLPDLLSGLSRRFEMDACKELVHHYMIESGAIDLANLSMRVGPQEALVRVAKLNSFVAAVSAMYARMVGGDGVIELLQEMLDNKDVYPDGFATDVMEFVDDENENDEK